MMFKLDKDINGFNVDATYTHIEPSEILLNDNYKGDYRMLRPKLSVVLSYKQRSVVKPYTLSAMDLIKNVKYKNNWGRALKYTGKYTFVVRDGESGVMTDEGSARRPIHTNSHSSSGIQISDLTFEYLPTQEDLKYILWGCLSDCAMVYEYDEDEFAETVMRECSIQKLRESEVVYNTIKNDIFNLAIGEDIIYETMNVLQEMGIE